MEETHPQSARKQPAKKRRPRRGGLMLLIVALILALGAAGYFYYRYHQANKDPQAQIEQRNRAETDRVLGSLTKILLIESDAPEPTVAKVEDVEKLKDTNPEFYKNIQTGDYLVLYPNRAIIYRQAQNQIINIAPIVDVGNTDNDGQGLE